MLCLALISFHLPFLSFVYFQFFLTSIAAASPIFLSWQWLNVWFVQANEITLSHLIFILQTANSPPKKTKKNSKKIKLLITQNKASREWFILFANSILPSPSFLFYTDSALAPATVAGRKCSFLPLIVFKIMLERFPLWHSAERN